MRVHLSDLGQVLVVNKTYSFIGVSDSVVFAIAHHHTFRHHCYSPGFLPVIIFSLLSIVTNSKAFEQQQLEKKGKPLGGHLTAVWRQPFPWIHTCKVIQINTRLRFNPWNTHQSIQEVTCLSAFPPHGTIIPSNRCQASLCSSSLFPFPRLYSDNPHHYRLSIWSCRQPSLYCPEPLSHNTTLVASWKAQSAKLFLTLQNVNFELWCNGA